MAGETIYRQRVTFCGKPGCRPCQSGRGHGPYWYAYQTVNGRTKQTYVGKVLPPHLAAEASTPAALIRLYALGQVRLERRTKGGEGEEAWYPVRDTTWTTVRPLLGALASNKERRLSLHQVRELLGSKASTADVQRAIDRLRYVLEPPRRVNQQHVLATRLVETTSDSLVLADQTRLWIDADAFESLVSQVRTISTPNEREHLLEEAFLLYNGDYWPTTSQRESAWVQERRLELHRQWLGLLLDLADLRRMHDNAAGAMSLLDRLLDSDPTHEAAVQRLMLLLAQDGHRGEALRLYQRFLATLSGLDTSLRAAPETQALYETIRSGEMLDHLTLSSAMPTPLPAETRAFPPPVGRSNQSRLVGRDRELATLHELLRDAEHQHQRRRGAVVLTGDAGIGKTRLVEEMARSAAQWGWMIAWGRAYPQEMSIPYRLWAETLRKVMRQGPGLRQELARRPHLYQPLLTLLPDLEGLLSPDQAALAPEPEPVRLWEAVRALLLALSEAAPLLIVLDDVQWADSSSCELLAYLVRQLRDAPLVVAATCRDSELPPTHPLHGILRDLRHEQALELMAIPPLSDEQIEQLVSGLPEPLVRSIQAHAAGNPFFAEELARAPNLPATLPDTIAAVLDLRLGRVSEACQRLLARCSVLGDSFDLSVLRTMASDAHALNEDQMLDLLEEALQAGILTEEGSSTRLAYSFWHPLVVTHLYVHLSAARRISLHRRAAEALQSSSAGSEQERAAALVYHLVNGNGDPASIATCAELAGDHAYHLSAYRDAERYYRLLLDRVPALSAQTPRDERQHRARIVERLGECAMIQGHYEEARLAYEQVLEIRAPLGGDQQDSLETQRQALLWGEIGWAWHYTGEHAKAWHCHMRGSDLLTAADISDGPAWASLRYQDGNFCWLEGRYEEAERAAREALACFEQQPAPARIAFQQETRIQRTLAGDPVNTGRIHILLATILTTTGEQTQAERHLQEALALFEEYDQLREIAIVAGNLGDLYLRRANHEAAQAAFRRALSIAEHMGDTAVRLATLGNLGVLAGRRGNVEEAVQLLRQALGLAEDIGDQVYGCLILTYLAPLLSQQQAREEASSLLRRALRLGRHIPLCAAFTLVTIAQVRLAEERATLAAPRAAEGVRPQQRLARIKATLRRALAMTGLEAEIRLEGQLALAEAHLLSQEIAAAESVLSHALDEARQQEWSRLVGVGERLLGEVLAARRQISLARRSFEEALALFRSCEMRLEEALTLWRYGLLLQRHDESAKDGQRVLEEARHLFRTCQVPLE